MPVVARDTVPAPFVLSPTQVWDGNDGPWSSFTYGIGTPAQWPRILISTSAVQPWAVVPLGCNSKRDPTDCPKNRGILFDSKTSSTWQDQGNFTLVSGESVGINENGNFGFDTVTLGLPGSANTAKLEHQIVAGIATKAFYIANWGIRPDSTNLTTLNDPIPSLLDNLKAQKVITSRSWGYTAGAYYMSLQNKGSLGSLTLGGYDTERFRNDSGAWWPMGQDTSRDLLVGLQAISVRDSGEHKEPASLLPSPSLAFIDSALPHMWLPLDACKAFESAFGLTWNSTLGLYLVNSTQHDSLVAQKATVTLTLGSDLDSKPTVDIAMPYGAFDLTLTPDYPNVTASTFYFPLRRAANASQVTLGRAFLQNAYVAADYERMLFAVNPALFPDGAAQSLRAIPALSADAGGSSSSASSAPYDGLSIGATVGIAIGALLGFFATCALAFFLWRRLRRRRHPPDQQQLASSDGSATPEKDPKGDVELDAPDAGLAGVYVGELEDREHKGELADTDVGSTPELPSPMLWGGKLKSELAGSPSSGSRSRFSGVKSMNEEALELPGSPGPERTP